MIIKNLMPKLIMCIPTFIGVSHGMPHKVKLLYIYSFAYCILTILLKSSILVLYPRYAYVFFFSIAYAYSP